MENNSDSEFFWPSYVDLMTALFAVVLVLFVFTYYNLNKQKKEIQLAAIKDKKDAEILRKIKSNLAVFRTDKDIFKRDTLNNRVLLAFDIQFKRNLYSIASSDINNFQDTQQNLDKLGLKLKSIIQKLKDGKQRDSTMRDISYLLVVSGSASNLRGDDRMHNYELSYKRAYALYDYWKKTLNLDLDSHEYHDIIELQIAGNGVGGVGRENVEMKNQRFIIHITPKIGD